MPTAKPLLVMSACYAGRPVPVLAFLFPILLPANTFGEAAGNSPVPGLLPPVWETRMDFLALSFEMAQT